MVFMVKKTGRWTRKLYDIATSPTDPESGSDPCVRVLVEGPYGKPADGDGDALYDVNA